MSTPTPAPGTVGWLDLTVPNADQVRDFYKNVVGWTAEALQMEGYSDYCMAPPAEGAAPIAGICHARGPNTDLPAQWLMYIIVEDLDHSMEQVRLGGGRVIAGPRGQGAARFCVIRDPAGAVAALYEPAKSGA